jgi:diguanylate cyclase (GGDEF)-like protein
VAGELTLNFEMARLEVDDLAARAWELRRQEPQQTLELSTQALARAQQLGYVHGVAQSLLAKAFALFRLGRLPEAQRDALEAKQHFSDLAEPQGLLRVTNTLGIIYGESGDLVNALKTFHEVDALCKDHGDRQGEVDALNNIGNVYAYLGDYVSALDYHFQSLNICKELGLHDAETRALLNLGVSYFELGQYQESLEYFSQSLKQGGNLEEHLHALLLRNLGRSYQHLGQSDFALVHLQQSLQLSRKAGEILETGYTLDSLAALALALEKWQDAKDYLLHSLELKTEAGDPKGQSETLTLLGQVCLRQGNLDEAKTYLETALDITEHVGNKSERYKVYQHLSEVQQQKENYQEALVSFQAYSRLREEILNETSAQHLQSLRLRFEVSASAREKELFRLKNEELAEKNAKLHKLNEALQKASTEKSQLLRELERQAREDALTGLYNRRYFDEVFSRAFSQAQRVNTPLSVAISDIDNFKLINDKFSHQMGDLVLRTVAKIMKDTVRDIDTVARYGGEEFVVLLPSANAEGAKAVCERIRKAVENYDWSTLNHDLNVTLSVGIADDLAVANYERLMAIADDKLYKAKRNGKNQVYV